MGTSRPRRYEPFAVTTTRASESARRAATAGAAKPEKIGTWIAPMCAHALRGDQHLEGHREVERDRVALADAEPDESLGEARDLLGESAEGDRAALAVLAAEDSGLVLGPLLGPAVHAVPGHVQRRAR